MQKDQRHGVKNIAKDLKAKENPHLTNPHTGGLGVTVQTFHTMASTEIPALFLLINPEIDHPLDQDKGAILLMDHTG